jgi:CheY-like chemotaxis protein
MVDQSNAAPGAPKGPYVLLVDDEPLVLYMLERALQARGLGVLSVGTSAAAVEACRQHGAAIGAVLLDVNLKGTNGPQTLVELRRLLPALPAALMSGSESGFTPEQLADMGVSHVFTKPFRKLDVLADLVRGLLAAEVNCDSGRAPCPGSAGSECAPPTGTRPAHTR